MVGEPLVHVQGATLKTFGIIRSLIANSPATWNSGGVSTIKNGSNKMNQNIEKVTELRY